MMTAQPDSRLPHRMRAPHCGQHAGWLQTVNGQDTVRCAACGTHLYNAPRDETGRGVRRLRTREDISVGTRAFVLERDGWGCVVCHRTDLDLEVGHLLSVADATAQGLTAEQYNDPANLAAMCAPCNSGQAVRSVPPWLAAALHRARAMRRPTGTES